MWLPPVVDSRRPLAPPASDPTGRGLTACRDHPIAVRAGGAADGTSALSRRPSAPLILWAVSSTGGTDAAVRRPSQCTAGTGPGWSAASRVGPTDRLPFHSPVFGGPALTVAVAVPAQLRRPVRLARRSPADDASLIAGTLLLGWLAAVVAHRARSQPAKLVRRPLDAWPALARIWSAVLIHAKGSVVPSRAPSSGSSQHLGDTR